MAVGVLCPSGRWAPTQSGDKSKHIASSGPLVIPWSLVYGPWPLCTAVLILPWVHGHALGANQVELLQNLPNAMTLWPEARMREEQSATARAWNATSVDTLESVHVAKEMAKRMLPSI